MSEMVRLSRQLVELGLVASRREADEAIEMGCVTVDGQRVDTLGARVAVGQQVTLTPSRLATPPARVTLLLHVAANDGAPLAQLGPAQRCASDRSGWAWLGRCAGHLQPGAPLPLAASGLAVWTQDAQLVRKLALEAADYEQEHLLWVDSALDAARVAALNAAAKQSGIHGLRFGQQSDQQLRAVLRSADCSGLPALLAHAGIGLLAWRRQRIGRLALGKLAPGQWRYLALGERF